MESVAVFANFSNSIVFEMEKKIALVNTPFLHVKYFTVHIMSFFFVSLVQFILAMAQVHEKSIGLF